MVRRPIVRGDAYLLRDFLLRYDITTPQDKATIKELIDFTCDERMHPNNVDLCLHTLQEIIYPTGPVDAGEASHGS